MDIVAIRRRASYPPTKSRNVRRGKTRNAIRFGPIASGGLDRRPVALSERLVRLGIDPHPVFRRRAGERAADLRRCAQREHPVRDLRLGRHERARGHHRPGTDAGAVQNRRAVADQALLTQGGRVDRAVVADRGARAHLGSLARRDVHDRAVLHVRAAADDDRVEVGAEHGVVPHRRVLLDRDVPDEHRGRGDERGRMDLRASSLEAEQWHGLDPRSMLGLLPSYAKPRGREGRMPTPRITAVATATPPNRFAQAELLALAGYRDARRSGFFSRSEIEGRHLYIDPATFRPAAYFLDDRLESAVAHAIFADGAAAVTLTTGGSGPAIVAHRTLFRPEHLDAMGFEYPGGRPRVVLSKDVRKIGAQMMGDMAEALMATQGLKREHIRYWVLHSAGRRVIDRARTLLELDEAQVAHARTVLRRYGNMSSATILFVLAETLRQESPVDGEWGLMIALGPGFAAEGALLRW